MVFNPAIDTVHVKMYERDADMLVLRLTSSAGEYVEELTREFFFDEKITLLLHKLERRSISSEEAQDLGTMLYQRLFPKQLRGAFEQLRGYASGSGGKGLRLFLEIDDPAMAALPWEMAYDYSRRLYLSLDAQLRLIRWRPPTTPPPAPSSEVLRVLALFVSPDGLPLLALDEERDRLRKVLARPTLGGLIDVNFIERPVTIEKVRLALTERKYHILHFAGHAHVGDRAGTIFLENESSEPVALEQDQLRILLRENGLRLVLLSAAETATFQAQGRKGFFARGAESDALAPALVDAGIPAVIALQGQITDRSAISFDVALYQGLADRLPLDEAVFHARQRMYLEDAHNYDWAMPVLYTAGVLDDNLLRFRMTSEQTGSVIGSQQTVASVGGFVGGDKYGIDESSIMVEQRISSVEEGGKAFGVAIGHLDAEDTGPGDEVTIADVATLVAHLERLRSAVAGAAGLDPMEKVQAMALVEELDFSVGGPKLEHEKVARLLRAVSEASGEAAVIAADLGRELHVQVGGKEE